MPRTVRLRETRFPSSFPALGPVPGSLQAFLPPVVGRSPGMGDFLPRARVGFIASWTSSGGGFSCVCAGAFVLLL